MIYVMNFWQLEGWKAAWEVISAYLISNGNYYVHWANAQDSFANRNANLEVIAFFLLQHKQGQFQGNILAYF